MATFKIDERQTKWLIAIGVIIILYMTYNELQRYDSLKKAKELLPFFK